MCEMCEVSSPLKILYLQHHTELSSLGGGERSLSYLLRGLNKELFEPIVGTSMDEGLFYTELLKLGIDVKKVPFKGLYRTRNPLQLFSFFLRYIRAVSVLVQLIKREKVDLVHSNSIITHLYGGVAAFLAGVPAIYHVRNIIELNIFGRLLLQFGSGLASKTIANSNAIREMLFKAGVPEGKCVVIYNAIDLDDYATVADGRIRGEIGLDESIPIVGAIGAIEPEKGQDIFIEAARIVLQSWPEVKFLVIGDVRSNNKAYLEYLNSVRSLVEQLQIDESVVFTGFRSDIKEVIADLDIVVLASRTESFGRTAMEAMAMEKPVAATNVGGIPEVVLNGETGLIVDTESPNLLAGALQELLADPKKARHLGEQGRKRVESFFSLKNHIKAMQDVYLALL